MEELKPADFPRACKYKIVYDTTPFIYESVKEVLKTLRDAITAGGASWCWCFCKTGERPIIPLIAVPVAIIGTFSVMAAMGFSA